MYAAEGPSPFFELGLPRRGFVAFLFCAMPFLSLYVCLPDTLVTFDAPLAFQALVHASSTPHSDDAPAVRVPFLFPPRVTHFRKEPFFSARSPHLGQVHHVSFFSFRSRDFAFVANGVPSLFLLLSDLREASRPNLLRDVALRLFSFFDADNYAPLLQSPIPPLFLIFFPP